MVLKIVLEDQYIWTAVQVLVNNICSSSLPTSLFFKGYFERLNMWEYLLHFINLKPWNTDASMKARNVLKG